MFYHRKSDTIEIWNRFKFDGGNFHAQERGSFYHIRRRN